MTEFDDPRTRFLDKLPEKTRVTGTSYGREIFGKASDAFITEKIERSHLWTVGTLRRCLYSAALDLIYVHPHDLPEKFRRELAELMALLTGIDGPEGSIIASIKAMSDPQVERAVSLITVICDGLSVERRERKDLS